jgi:hypothetical protein
VYFTYFLCFYVYILLHILPSIWKTLDPLNICIYVRYNNNISASLENIHEARCRQLSQTREVLPNVFLCVRTETVIMLLWLTFCNFHFVSPFSDCVSYWLCIDSGATELLWKKNCPSATLSTINLIWTWQGSNVFFNINVRNTKM